jgi:hypothetical protein
MNAPTHFFIPMDELEDNELTSAIGGQLGAMLLGVVGLHELSELFHGLDAAGSLTMVQRPSVAECARATQAALANGSLLATPLGDRRGIWVPLSWLPEPDETYVPKSAPEPKWKVRAMARQAEPKQSIWASLRVPTIRSPRLGSSSSPWPNLRAPRMRFC